MARQNFLTKNGTLIRTLDELRENFNSSQMLAFFREGHLQKWLNEIGLTMESESVKNLKKEYDDDTLLPILMAILGSGDFEKNILMKAPTDESPAEKTESGQLTDSPEKGFHWFLGRMNQGAGEANCSAIAENALCDIEDPNADDEVSIERIFFYGGYFFAVLHLCGDTDRIVQSSDLKHWSENAAISDFGYQFLNSGNAVVSGDDHCFVFSTSRSGNKRELFIGSSDLTWKKVDLPLPDGYQIAGLFEKNKKIAVCYSSSEKSGILLAESLFALSKRKFSDIEIPRGISSVGISSCFFFQNRFFYWRGAKFFSADTERWNFEPVECDWWSFDRSVFSFEEMAFMVVRQIKNSDLWGVYRSADGRVWQEIEFDFDGVVPAKIFRSENLYYALSENEGGYCRLFYSSDGAEWKLRTKICCSGFSLVGEAGNRNIVLTTGENEYLFCSLE